MAKKEGFFDPLKGALGLKLPKGHHVHEGLLDQEKIVLFIVMTLFFAYFALSLFTEGAHRHVISGFTFSSASFSELWNVFVVVWYAKIRPMFTMADIVLILIGVYVLVRVWPLKQSMVLFRLKPHSHAGHGHEHHGHVHDAHAAAQGTAAHAPQNSSAGSWNEALKHNPATLKHWTSIVHRANTGTPENLRWAVMEGDALIDQVLRQRGMPGENMSERLQNARWAGSKLIDRVFDAHRVRNELAHTPGYQLTTAQAERALFAFRDFLKELREF
jgi:hypothetical protein